VRLGLEAGSTSPSAPARRSWGEGRGGKHLGAAGRVDRRCGSRRDAADRREKRDEGGRRQSRRRKNLARRTSE
jgi:hypothetical protein